MQRKITLGALVLSLLFLIVGCPDDDDNKFTVDEIGVTDVDGEITRCRIEFVITQDDLESGYICAEIGEVRKVVFKLGTTSAEFANSPKFETPYTTGGPKEVLADEIDADDTNWEASVERSPAKAEDVDPCGLWQLRFQPPGNDCSAVETARLEITYTK